MRGWLRYRAILVEHGQLELPLRFRRIGDIRIGGKPSRLCVSCGELKPLADFPKNGEHRRYDCKACHAAQQKQRGQRSKGKAANDGDDEMQGVRSINSGLSAWDALTRRRNAEGAC